MKQKCILIVALSCMSLALAQVITKVDNGLAGQQFVYQPPSQNFIQKCEVKGKPLDMMIIVDSSGSVQEKWPQVQQVLKSVVNYITVAPDGSATRVSMLIYAKNVRKIFDFNTFFRREDMLKAIDAVRPINGVTNTGNALNKSRLYWTEERGMRGAQVPKFLFLFSDGRASDFPLDTDSALVLREQLGIPIYVYGYGEHLDWNPLREIVGGDGQKIVNSRNATEMFNWIAPWKGIEICEEVPACIPGAHRPVDILFIVDVSSSFDEQFPDTVNFMQRTMNFINVHPDAARVAMIMYSTRPELVFDFNKFKDTNAVVDLLLKLEGPKVSGTTGTAEALKLATEVFEPIYGARDSKDAKRLAIIMTDGHSTSNPNVWARRLRGLKDVDVVAVGLKPADVDLRELTELVGRENTNRIFIAGTNLLKLEDHIAEHYTDRTCPGIELIDGADLTQADAVKVELPPIEAKCTAQGIFITVRTSKTFNGTLFTLGYADDVNCVAKGLGEKETDLILKRGSCGVKITETEGGYKYTAQLGIRFHDYVYTSSDEAQEVECQVFEPLVLTEQELSALKKAEKLDENRLTIVGSLDEATCQYNIEKDQSSCKLLDAEVGSIVEHEWTCNMPDGYRFLVHDCTAQGENKNDKAMYLLSNEGCQTDAVLLGTPKYDKDVKKFGKVTQRSAIFKLPSATSIQFKCLISLCDLGSVRECKYMFSRTDTEGPLACKNEGPLYQAARIVKDPIDYDNPPQNDKFARVISVSSRIMNVYDIPKLTQKKLSAKREYCSSL